MNKLFTACLAVLLGTCSLYAGDNKKEDPQNYVRSSLYTILMQDDGLIDPARAQIVLENFLTTPIPEKYNDHNLTDRFRTFRISDIKVSEDEIKAFNESQGKETKKDSGAKKFGKSLASSSSAGLIDTTDLGKLPVILNKYIDQQYIPQQLIAKWYDYSNYYDPETQSYFDMELIKERGMYNATEFDKSIAEKSTRGLSMLADAGENLINNTFVVGVRFNYVDKAEVASQAKSTAKNVGGMFGAKGKLIGDAVGTGAEIGGKGYVIKATAFLFRLDWNEEASETFYNKYWSATNFDEFLTDDVFKLTYIGSATEWSDIQSSAFSKASEAELVNRAAVRSLDEVIAKLQKEFDVFKTKTPIVTVEPEITAYVGMKEGLVGGEKFEVLEKEQDPETGITKYNKVGTITVEKDKVWDNRYGADEERSEKAAEEGKEATPQEYTSTVFKGNTKNLAPGMLIRQVK